MEKTALTQLIDLMQELEATDNPVYNKAKELIEVEYRQIEDAYNKGVMTGIIIIPTNRRSNTPTIITFANTEN